MSEPVLGLTRNYVDDGTSRINEAYTPPVIHQDDNILRSVATVKIASDDYTVNIDISQNEFNGFVNFLNNEVGCKILRTDIFGVCEGEREIKSASLKDDTEDYEEIKGTQDDQIDAEEGYCNECGKRFKTERGLHKHWKLMHEIKEMNHKCDLCDFQSEYRFKLKHHINKFHNPAKTEANSKTRNICDFCGKSFYEPYKLRLHVSEVHEGSKEYHCKKCDFVAKKSYALRNHMIYKHNEGNRKTLLCEFCPYSNVNRSSLKDHIERMHLQIKYNCEEEGCEYIANCKRSIREHQAFHIAQRNGDMLQCSTCGKEFPTNKLLKSHARSHKNKNGPPTEKQCEFCDYKTTQPKMFERHVYFRHTRENAKEKERYKGWDWEVMREKWRNGKKKSNLNN